MKNKSIKIAHLSDLHLCKKYKPQNIVKTEKLIKYALEQNVEHFVITGDISDNSNENDYLILRKILETYKLLRSDKTSIIIGNHDIYGGVQLVSDITNFPSRCLRTNYKEKVHQFVNYFKELFENTISFSKENPFPFAKIIGDVALIGINSIDEYSKIKNPFASNGRVSKRQRKDLKRLLNLDVVTEKTKVIMIHHHFYKNNIESKSSNSTLWNKIEGFTMKLRGKRKLLKLFKKNGIQLVLHGHSHELKEYHRNGIKFVNAGASLENENEKQPALFIIELNQEAIHTTLNFVRDNQNKSGFIEILDTNKLTNLDYHVSLRLDTVC